MGTSLLRMNPLGIYTPALVQTGLALWNSIHNLVIANENPKLLAFLLVERGATVATRPSGYRDPEANHHALLSLNAL